MKLNKSLCFFVLNLIMVFSITSCGIVLSRKLVKKNPLSYQFDFPIDTVRNKVENIKYLDRKFIQNKGNENKFELWCFYGGKSKLYHNLCNDLLISGSFYIVLDSISKFTTNVRIESDLEVVSGFTISTNHGIPIFVDLFHKVKPSSIEEYEILKIIGIELGQKDMPEINYPK